MTPKVLTKAIDVRKSRQLILSIYHCKSSICVLDLTLNVIWGILDCYLHFMDIVRCVNFTNIVVSCSSHSIYVRTQYYKVWYMNTNILSNLNRHVSFKLSEERETRCTRLFFESRDVYIVSKKELNTMDQNFLFYIIDFVYCWFHSLFIQELYTFLVSMPPWIYILQLKRIDTSNTWLRQIIIFILI